MAKDSGVNTSLFMCHAVGILVGSQACALHTRGSWSSQLFLTKDPQSQQNQTLLMWCWNSAHLKGRALLSEVPLAHNLLLFVYSAGFPLGSPAALSAEGA